MRLSFYYDENSLYIYSIVDDTSWLKILAKYQA